MFSFYCCLAQTGRAQFATASKSIATQLKRILDGWCTSSSITPSAIVSVWQEAETLPPLPSFSPSFVDTRLRAPNELGHLTVYQHSPHQFTLSFYHCAVIQLDLSQQPMHVKATILSPITDHIIFEDIVFTALAAPLRRLGIYLLHAFALSSPNQTTAVLLVGPSQSGKTSTGLNLLLNQWHLLANDVVALQSDHSLIYAYPTPNLFTIRPQTFHLLPQLQQLVAEAMPKQSISYPSHQLIHGRWGLPAPVKTIFFPSVKPYYPNTEIAPLPKTISISHLLEESLDLWDTIYRTDHAQIFSHLINQSSPFSLAVGSDINQIPNRIEQAALQK